MHLFIRRSHIDSMLLSLVQFVTTCDVRCSHCGVARFRGLLEVGGLMFILLLECHFKESFITRFVCFFENFKVCLLKMKCLMSWYYFAFGKGFDFVFASNKDRYFRLLLANPINFEYCFSWFGAIAGGLLGAGLEMCGDFQD